MQEREAKPVRSSPINQTYESLKKPLSHIPQVLTAPREWVHMYGDFITKNASSVSQIESALRSLTYIIPGRFRDAEIASESIYSGVQLLSLYHDTLLAKAVSRLPGMQRQQTPHNRYTKFWIAKSASYRRTAMFLQIIQYTELLWEMAAKRKGEKVRWRVVVLLEAIKAICRLLLLRITNSRPLVTPALPEREAVPTEPALEEEEEEEMLINDSATLPSKIKEWAMPRTGLSLPTLPAPSDISTYLLSKVLTADDVKPATKLLHRTNGSAQIAEYLYILRPVLYAIALARAKSRGTSLWQPWLLGLSIELSARQLRKASLEGRWNVTGLEREEWNKRGWAMGWWMMRSGFYESVAQGAIGGITDSMRGKIGLDLVAGILDDYKYLWDTFYFSTATM